MNHFPPNPQLVELAVELHKLAQVRTYHMERMEAMGFQLHGIEVKIEAGDLEIQALFKCVCGTEESFREVLRWDEIRALRFPGRMEERVDVARSLHELGSFSQKHLEDDGYSQEDVRRILQKGEEFDRKHKRTTPPELRYRAPGEGIRDLFAKEIASELEARYSKSYDPK